MDSKKGIVLTGAVVGVVSVLLVYLGNPLNMGMCIACFLRDIAGALGLHRAEVVQYLRPEIMGIVLGAFLMSIRYREFCARGGSSPFLRFCLGFIVMVGALMFLGCPLRMVLRIGGGDLNAILGLVGFAVGIVIGIFFLKKGFSLKRNYKLKNFEGYVFPGINVFLLGLLIVAPGLLFFSEKGPGSLHATIITALLAGLIIGAFSQRTRLCMVGGIRDLILFKDNYLIIGFLTILIFTAAGNIMLGYFQLGFANQPVAHSDGFWNILGMVVVGWGSVLLGGCPLRQLILSAEGNIDSVITVMGMILGAAISHNFGLAASPAGPSNTGKIAVLLGVLILAMVSYVNTEATLKIKGKGEIKIGTN